MRNYQERAAYIAAYPPPPAPTKMSSGWHIFHLLMTFFTFGLWGIVWAIHAVIHETSVTQPMFKRVQDYWNWIEYLFPSGPK